MLLGRGRLEVDVVAHALELANEVVSAGVGVLALDEVVPTELVLVLSVEQDVVGDHQDGVADGDDGLARPPTAPYPPELGGQVGVLGV